MMKICIVDTENNTPQTELQRGEVSRSEWAPIIEIGAVMLDVKSGRVISTFQVFINPRESIFPEITALTTITDADVTGPNSTDIKDGLARFYEWMDSHQCRFMSAWGRDCDEIEERAKKFQVKRPNSMRKLDIKGMFEILKCGLPNKKLKGGLKNTLETFGMSFDLRQHRAVNDSLETAKLLFFAKELMYFFHIIDGHKFKSMRNLD